jgi:hypothetical protein
MESLKGIGVQSGLLYNYNYLLVLSIDISRYKIEGTGLFYFLYDAYEQIISLDFVGDKKNIFNAHLDGVTFCALSFPLSYQFYQERTRQLVMYGGPHFRLALSNQKIQTCSYVC